MTLNPDQVSLLPCLMTLVLIGVTLQPAQAVTTIKLTDIYSVAKITEVYLEVPPASETSLNTWANLEKYVTAKVKFVQGELEVRSNHHWSATQGQHIASAAQAEAFDEDQFNWGDALKGQRFLGLKNMTLHSLTPRQLVGSRIGAYKLYNSMGVVAPNTGWAEVFVNGKSKGVYLNVETPDDIFLSKRFKDPTSTCMRAQAFPISSLATTTVPSMKESSQSMRVGQQRLTRPTSPR
jgi:spore coat protein CotH